MSGDENNVKINYKAIIFLALLFLCWRFIYDNGSDSTSNESAQKLSDDNGGDGNVNGKTLSDLMPPDELSFVRIVTNSKSAVSSASNDMQVGGIKAARDNEICKLLINKSVNGWVAKVSDVSSNSDGKGVFSMEVSPDVSIGTWNNSFSDMSDGTLIEPGSDVFKVASNLSDGDIVKFSGEFIPDNDGCIRESSMTLRGKTESPDFIFKFNGVEKVK